MFKKKTVLEVLRQCNDIKLSNDILSDLYRTYENYNYVCEKARIEEIYNYGKLCTLFFSHEFSENNRCIVQKNHMIVDANHPTNSINIPACYQMNPAKEALIILNMTGHGLRAKIFKYVPHSFEHSVSIDNIEYLRLNFDCYDVYKVEQFKSKLVENFNELSAEDSIIAFSKEQLPYDRNGKTYYFPVILRYN